MMMLLVYNRSSNNLPIFFLFNSLLLYDNHSFASYIQSHVDILDISYDCSRDHGIHIYCRGCFCHTTIADHGTSRVCVDSLRRFFGYHHNMMTNRCCTSETARTNWLLADADYKLIARTSGIIRDESNHDCKNRA